MGIIRELNNDIAKKIAATEVIERPFSVVKELVENSIDAGASMITVRIERGGISRIQVTDNGCGMAKEDAEKCFLRHYTSKIYTEEDLQEIYTMGFRGEALSSIAAVSQVDLYTKREQDEVGAHIIYADGAMADSRDEGMPDGTTFAVSNLFYNVPARMKFLKRDATEASYITDLMARFILSHPEISFRYINSRKEIYFSAGDNNLVNAIYTVYGKDFAKSVIPVDYEKDGIKVSGLIGKSDISRANRNYQSFFVNRRYIKSALMCKALENAYKNQIMAGKHPAAVLNVDINAAMTDVNSHPTKQEIKFINDCESSVFTAVFHAVENALYSDYSIPKIERVKENKPAAFKADIVKSDAQYELEWNKQKDRWTPADEVKPEEKPILPPEPKKEIPESYEKDVSPEYFQKRKNQIMKEAALEDKLRAESFLKEDMKIPQTYTRSSTPFFDAVSAKIAQKTEKELLNDEKETVDDINFKVIGQIFSTYVIVEKDDEMLLIDQHAAHERLKYEEIKKELEHKKVLAQDLLIPVSVKLAPTEYEVFSENKEFLNELGFEAEDFGENTIVVRTAPSYVEYDDIEQLLVELISQISENKQKPMAQKTEYAIYTIACKAAIKANHIFDRKELENLCERVFALGSINTCPHGRPITVSMTKKELEKEFKRIV